MRSSSHQFCYLCGAIAVSFAVWNVETLNSLGIGEVKWAYAQSDRQII